MDLTTVKTKAQFYTKDVTELFPGSKESGCRSVFVYKNYWWLCRNGDPKQAIFFNTGSPQCNSNRKIMEHAYDSGTQAERIGRTMGWTCSVIQIPLAFINHD